mgnify:CR=1 FL=1
MEEPNIHANNDYPPRKSNRKWIYIGIIALLIGSNIFFFLTRNKQEIKHVTVVQQLAQANNALTDLQAEYNASLVRLDELTGKNASLDRLLKQKDSELSKTKARIQEILAKNANASAAEIAEARQLIKSLNVKLKDYERQITFLKKQNSQLTVERDSVMEQNETLQEKVDLATVLHASNIRLKAIDLRRGGRKERETEKAKRVDLFRITFDIDENRFAESGTKELLIRITDPDGDLMSNSALGSGNFKMADGNTRYYSLPKFVMLQTEQPLAGINVDWQQSAEYEKGVYHVEIYHKGYLIGKGSVSLR